MKTNQHNTVVIRPCALGRGLFAARSFKDGERILRFCGPEIDFATVLNKGAAQANPLQIGFNRYIDLAPPGVFANHSCNPNAGIVDDIWLIAIRNISAGEEILYDYSTTMWEGHWTMDCACNSPQCRGLIDDFHTLPHMQQRHYLKRSIVQRFIVDRLMEGVTAHAASA